MLKPVEDMFERVPTAVRALPDIAPVKQEVGDSLYRREFTA